jgi:predicted amidohydrolase
MIIALASPPIPKNLAESLSYAETLIKDAAEQGAKIICFPESYLPGYPGMGASKGDRSPEVLAAALSKACERAAAYAIAVIMPMDWHLPGGLFNLAHVISDTGEILGYQTKNQLDPSEDHLWIPGNKRSLFEVKGMKFGITICHEGFRYPESVRWAAQHGAHLVFHPHFTGSDTSGVTLTDWGSMDNPYYEKAMMMRALENTIYFASSNYASAYSESATSIIAPDGKCIAHAPYGKSGVIVADINPELATGLLAKRFKNSLYQ